MKFWNTTHLTGDALAQAVRAASNQDDAVLALFADGKTHTPSEIWKQTASRNWPLTSIRRSITGLEHAGLLVKTGDQYVGIYNRPEYAWRRADVSTTKEFI